MKRFISAFVSFTLVFSMTLPSYVIGESAEIVNESGSSTTEYQKASKETLELARNVVQELESHAVFCYTLGYSLDYLYYEVAKYSVPGTKILETKSDASLALLEIYEEMLSEFREYDIDRYHAYLEAGQIVQDDDYILRGWKLFRCRENIEAMLALDCYYNLLDENEVQRMTDDFAEFADLNCSSWKKFDVNAECNTLFEIYRAGVGIELSTDQGKRGLSLGDIKYDIGSTVKTTSGN